MKEDTIYEPHSSVSIIINWSNDFLKEFMKSSLRQTIIPNPISCQDFKQATESKIHKTINPDPF